jgi:FkbM family methyltransferase
VLFLHGGARVVAVEPQRHCQERLRDRFGADPRFTLVPAALGPEPGETEILQPNSGSTLASMSQEWIDSVRSSGRFPTLVWSETERVEVTTFDTLIDRFGVPAFSKIDVEGYESEVLQGLSRPIPTLSLEFTPEHLAAIRACVDQLEALGRYEYNYSLSESLVLAEETWLSADAVLAELQEYATNPALWGDVYARLAA